MILAAQKVVSVSMVCALPCISGAIRRFKYRAGKNSKQANTETVGN